MILKHGKLYVIEGLDGCGKETQSKLLRDNLILSNNKSKVKYISFPNYDSISSSLVKSYLNGDFGKNAESVNPYQASSFFAVDRVSTYLLEMKDFLDNDGIIICDRYVTSNILYQATKIKDKDEREEFLYWLKDFEYNRLGLPIPTKTFFLNVSKETFMSNIKNRDDNKHTGKDIHEDNLDYLSHIYDVSNSVVNENGWILISCENKNKEFLSKTIISKKIMDNI